MATIEHLQDRTRGHELATIVKTELAEVQRKRDTSWHDEFPHYVAAGTALLEGRRLYPSNREFGEWVSREGLWEFGDRFDRHALMRLAINADRIRVLAAKRVTGLTERRTPQTIIKGAEDLLDAAGAPPLIVVSEFDESNVESEAVIVEPFHNGKSELPNSSQSTESSATPHDKPKESPSATVESRPSPTSSSPEPLTTADDRALSKAVGRPVAVVLIAHYQNKITRGVLAEAARQKANRPALEQLAELIRAGRLETPVSTQLRKLSPRLLSDLLPREPSYEPNDKNSLVRLMAMAEDYLLLAEAIRLKEVANDPDTLAKWIVARQQRHRRLPASPADVIVIETSRPRLAAEEGPIIFWGKPLWPISDPVAQEGWTFDIVFAAFHFYQHLANNLRATQPEEQALTISQFCKWMNNAEARILVSVLQQMIGAIRLVHGDRQAAGKTVAPPVLPTFR